MRIPTCVLVCCLSTVCCGETNWNQFRGPNGDGVSTATDLPAKIEEGSAEITWKTPIHGKGWSSPVAWGDRIWMQTAPEDGKSLYAVCVDAVTGKIVHDIKVFDVADPQFCHPTNSYASGTPFLEAGRVYVHFGRYGTACLDSETGKTLWRRRDLTCDHFRGPAASPIVDGDLLFAAFDGIDVQFVVAMNKNTGEVVWNKTRDIAYGTDNGDRKKAYSTAKVIEVKGRKQLVSPSAVETVAYGLEDGKVLWRVKHDGMNAAARPLYVNGLLYLSAGSGPTTFIALRPEGSGDITDSIVWKTNKGVPRRSSQIVSNGLLFMVSDDGVATCRDAANGDMKWQTRLRGEYWASPALADGKIYYFSKDGGITVLKASGELQKLSETNLDSGFNASPGFVGNAMILRTFQHLYRVESK
ncbi:MAG: PQQ-binding-like beta-propeller repeat protein [Planctomycetota bacterium]|nr:PQQ-binding-like beta-propeller repeat protein [Planctomycetota bacterium]